MSSLKLLKKTTFQILIALMILSEIKAEPIKVYILAGQSNMEGHAKIKTFDYLKDDPNTAPLLNQMCNSLGRPREFNNIRISYLTGSKNSNGEAFGKLTSGFGARIKPSENGGKIGPELTFGITMEQAHKRPILIIKTAWGGKSLHTDFRPPSAGPYKLNAWQNENYPKQTGHGIPKDFEQWKIDKKKATGQYYKMMSKHVKKVLGDISRVYPEYDEKQGYELAGFIWFQGWNDFVDRHTYPGPDKPGRFKLYSELMAHFIRDVRKEFKTPKLPFVIGVMGVGGLKDKKDYFREAMAAPAALPEFKGNVMAVETAPFWDQALGEIDQKRQQVRQMSHFLRSKHKDYANKKGNMSLPEQKKFILDYKNQLISPEENQIWERGASDAAYHYLGCAKTMALIGRAFAQATLEMELQK